MSFLVATAIVLAVMGSVFWIMPSPAERKKMQLRNHAIRKGFGVKFVYDTDKDLNSTHRGQYIGYSITAEKLGLAKSRPFEIKLLSDKSCPDGWKVALSIGVENDEISRLIHQLCEYAGYIDKLTLSCSTFTFYWQERAGKDVLDGFADKVVSNWRALIVNRGGEAAGSCTPPCQLKEKAPKAPGHNKGYSER